LNRRQLGPAILLVAACGLAAGASFTRPFTLPADVVTAIALVAMLVAQGVVFLTGRRRRLALVHADASDSAGSADPADSANPKSAGVLRRFGAWIAIVTLVVCFELLTYFETPRRAHPTLSYLADDLISSHGGKAALFLAWLMLGWLLVKRHAPSRPRVDT
jgi:hypothetical protein